MENNIKTCSLKVRNFTFENSSNPQFLKTKFFAISEGENLNRSSFDIEGMKECLSENDYTFKPILGSWKKDSISEVGFGNFGGHDSDIEADTMSGEIYNTYLGEGHERPLGLILPNSAKIEEFKGKQWLTFEGLIWSEYNKEAVRLLKKKRTNSVSVEIRVLESSINDEGIELIKKFTLLGITIIGVRAGIEDAHLDVENFSATKQFSNFVKVFSSKLDDVVGKTIEFIKQDQYGSGDKLDISLSKDDASNDAWGPVNKTKLRNDLLRAKNYKSLIPKSYLVVMDGWEEAPSEKLKYPIVQIKEGKVVLNINGVQTAGSYLMKEKDESYFRTAKAKLNRIRKILGMEKLMALEFGIETNKGVDVTVSQNQPNIIKMEGGKSADMEIKEIVSKLSELFKAKETCEEEYKALSSSYEDKVGEYELADEEDKEELKSELDKAKEEMEAKNLEVMECSDSIIELSNSLVKMEDIDDNDDHDNDDDKDKDDDNDDDDDKPQDKDVDDRAKIDDEEEEYPIDTEGKSRYVEKLEEGSTYISNSKNYVIFEKDGNLYASKLVKTEEDEISFEEKSECNKVYVNIVTGGVGSPENAVAMPSVNVEITKGVSGLYRTLREKDDRIADLVNEVVTLKEEVAQAQTDKDKYKVDVKAMLTRFEEMIYSENTTKEFKEDMYSKIFENKFENTEDFETKVKAGLYELNKSKFLSGSFVKSVNNSNENYSERQKINDIIKSYDKK